jgi:flagellar motor switch protein FliM
MTEILTQEEIDALIFGMAGGEEDKTPGQETAPVQQVIDQAAVNQAPAVDINMLIQSAQKDVIYKQDPKKDYKLYDFRRPEKFSKNQVRAVRNIMEILARQLNNIIANLLRFNTEVALIEVGQCNYGDLHRTAPLNSIIGLFSLEENKAGHGVMHFSTELTFTMIERLMGGDGSPDQIIRDLTEFEKMIVTDIFQRFLDPYTKAMREMCMLSGRISHIETDEKMIPKAFPPDETFVKVTFEIRFPKNRGFIILSIPYFLIAPHFRGGKHSSSRGRLAHHSIEVDKIPRNVMDLKFAAEIQLGSSTFTIRDLLALKPGSIVLLDRKVDESLEVVINNTPKFKVKPGYVDKKMGVQITSIITEEREDNE